MQSGQTMMKIAYSRGQRAAKAGLTLARNPYIKIEPWRSWNNGFRDEKKALANR